MAAQVIVTYFQGLFRVIRVLQNPANALLAGLGLYPQFHDLAVHGRSVHQPDAESLPTPAGAYAPSSALN